MNRLRIGEREAGNNGLGNEIHAVIEELRVAGITLAAYIENVFSIKMSVDEFDLYVRQKGAKTRGPPGVGFNFTTTGHFDIENKKLYCKMLYCRTYRR